MREPSKPDLTGTIVILLLIVSIPLTIAISSNIPVVSTIFHNQQAMAQKKTTSASIMPNFFTYHNSTYGINIQYPSDWVYKGSENKSNANSNNISDQAQPIVTFVPQDESIHALVTIGTVNLPLIFKSVNIGKDNMSFFAPFVINSLKQSTPGFKLIESNTTSVKATANAVANGNSATTSVTIPAQKIVYTAAGPVHKTMAVYTIKGNKAFFIGYLTGSEAIYSSYLPIAQKMIDSFQVGNGKPSSSSASSQKETAELNAAREQLLLAWNRTGFRSQFDTFVNSADGYGVYEEHKSNVFKPGEPIILYVEPVGFTHKTISGVSNNTKLYLINMTAGIVLSDKQGNILLGRENIPLLSVISHNKNTELFMKLRVTQTNPFPAGEYVITYTVTDVPSGKNFKIVKDIVIAGISSSSSNSLAAVPEAGGGRPLSPANQNDTSPSAQIPCPYGLPRQLNGVCPIILETS
jgi:hypothetical protein